MNTQSSNGTVDPVQVSDELFSNWRGKFLLFIGAFIVAMFLAWLAYANYYHIAFNELWKDSPILFYILFFPSGLPFSSAIGTGIYWLVYIALIVSGIWMKNIVRSRMLFLIFLILLILNIAGCAGPSNVEITMF